MEWLQILSAPIIGAIIGYSTNYIAVKMLFRPLYPITIGKFKVPFTPGIIPKRKPALARAIGQMVGKSLVGEEEIRQILTSDSMKETVARGIMSGVTEGIRNKSVKELATNLLEEETYAECKEASAKYITDKIVLGAQSIDIGSIIATEGAQAVKEMGGMIAMFVNESLIASFAEPIGKRVISYMETEGRTLVAEKVQEEFSTLESRKIEEMITMDQLESLKESIGEMYQEMVNHEMADLIAAFDICGVVEKKINEMDVKELEQLIMSVMKHELRVIVNLGALIGFVLGLLNLMF